MNVLRVLTPLSDITNLHNASKNTAPFCSVPHLSVGSFQQESVPAPALRFQHDPYSWKCLPESEEQCEQLLAIRAAAGALKKVPFPPQLLPVVEPEPEPKPAVQESAACRCLIQFKCHQAEYSSAISLDRGQYVVVQGDRGIDIGVVIRINTDAAKSYVERTGPCGSVMRHATQREVDYWASELKADESVALEFCRQRIIRNNLPMEVRHAEYQFDKKKLTFYYDAKSRVDFVNLLKELYREYGCRIWMEKVRAHE